MVRVLQLKQQLQTIKKGFMSIFDYVMKIKAVGDELNTVGHTITDADLVLSVLGGLSHEYDPVVVLVSHQSKTMSLEDAEYALMLHEQRIEQFNTSSQIKVNVASANFASNFNGNRNQRALQCYKCFDQTWNESPNTNQFQQHSQGQNQGTQHMHPTSANFVQQPQQSAQANFAQQQHSAYFASTEIVNDPIWYADSGPQII
ncbi:hypothetical protein ACOSQ2_019610 [Xanthoceras sorbifolium]